MRYIGALLLVFACFHQTKAQHFHAGNSPLISDHVRCAAVSSDGRVWFGTDFGLAMFDGLTLVVYTESNSIIPDHHIRSLTADDQGFVWVGTQNSGAFLFDGSTISEHYHTANSGITDNTVNATLRDTLNRLWFGTTGGMNRFDGSTWTSWRDDNSTVWSNHVTSMVLDSNTNYVYAGHINGGIVAYRDTITVYISYLMQGFPDNSITHISQDENGWLWCSSPSSGLIQFFPQSDNWVAYKTANTTIPENTILGSCFFNGALYFGSQTSGLVKKTGTNFTSYNHFFGVSPGKVNDVVFDQLGTMWLATEFYGVIGLPAQELGIESYDELMHTHQCWSVRAGESISLPENINTITLFDLHGRVVYQSSGNLFSAPNVSAGQYVLWLNESLPYRLLIID